MYDALAARAYVTKIPWNPDNPLNGPQPDDPRPVASRLKYERYCAASRASSSSSSSFKSSGRGVEMML